VNALHARSLMTILPPPVTLSDEEPIAAGGRRYFCRPGWNLAEAG
jgi:hypothetical protein